MQVINFFSNLAMPMVIFFIVLYGITERVKVFDNFLEGAKEGIKTRLLFLFYRL